MKRRDFLKRGLAGLTAGIASSGIKCQIPLRDPNVRTDVLHLPYGNYPTRDMYVGVWYNPDFTGERPLIISSHGFSASSIDLGSAHNYLANKGYVVLAPDHEDVINFMSADGLKSYSDSQEFQEVINQFGSVDNYVRTLVFSPYLELQEQEKGIININLDLIANLFIGEINKLREIPEYSNYTIRDSVKLILKSVCADVEDVRVNDLFGEALYDSRVKDISNLLDFSIGDNRMGNNPQGRNALDEKFKGAVKVDVNKIGGVGYSLGGGTMLELLGAGDICNGKTYYDSRFSTKPMVLIAPASALNHKENFSEIKNNILFFGGDKDFLTKGIARRQPMLGDLVSGSKEVIIYENTGHLTFSDTACETALDQIFSSIPGVEEVWGNCDSHEQLVPIRDEYLGLFFDREFSLKGEKQTALIDYALETPFVRYATSDPIIKEEFEAEFPEYAGQI